MQRKLDDDFTKQEILRMRNDGYSFHQIAKNIGVDRSTIGMFLNKVSYREWWNEHEKPFAQGNLFDHYKNIKRLKGKRFIFTSAQNSTYVHEKFLKSLENCAEYLGAQLIVGTFTYNKNAFQNLNKGSEDIWFDDRIKDYILDEPAYIADGLIWCGELNILPTAVNPLSGLYAYCRENSGIVPHVKLQLDSLPTHKSNPCRMLYTTGTVTQRNYIQQKTGQKASFHHVFGALLVEVDSDGQWFVRQLVAASSTGEFQDLDVIYTPDSVSTGNRVEAITWGDIHIEKADPSVLNTAKDILLTLKPKYQFIHDVLDMEARNHHNIDDPYFRYKMHIQNKENVEQNVKSVAEYLKSIQVDDCQIVVVESNHDLAFRRWLKNSDYKSDPENAIFFLRNQLASYEAIRDGNSNFSIFEYAVRQMDPELNCYFLRTDESFMICNENNQGIECGSHGDKGPNGSRGSINNYVKLGSRYTIGHSHTAGIRDGVYQTGHMMDVNKADYAKGPSSWSNSSVITYPNGKRTMITIKNNKWKG